MINTKLPVLVQLTFRQRRHYSKHNKYGKLSSKWENAVHSGKRNILNRVCPSGACEWYVGVKDSQVTAVTMLRNKPQEAVGSQGQIQSREAVVSHASEKGNFGNYA